jgi:hypothetical protein
MAQTCPGEPRQDNQGGNGVMALDPSHDGRPRLTEDGYVARFWDDVEKAMADVEHYRRGLRRRLAARSCPHSCPQLSAYFAKSLI